jgi:uncharacterized protein (DUF1800 family)
MAETLTGRSLAARLVQRTGFGATAAEIDAVASLPLADAVARLVAPGDDPGEAATPPPELREPPRGKSNLRTEAQRKERATLIRQERRRLAVWWLDRLVATRRPWVEKRTLLWLDHWATSIHKVKSAPAMLGQYATLRRLGAGDFETLAATMVRDPALMEWLDASGNTAKAPNENLARELMELFVLGHGAYTEDDVKQVARTLTGWRLDIRDGAMVPEFVPARHAAGTQTVLGTTADLSDRALVDLLVRQPASPAYLVTRFWGRLVGPDAPPEAALRRAVAAYGDRLDLAALFTAVLTDEAMTADDSVLVKQPVEYVVGALRAFGIRPSDLDDKQTQTLLSLLKLLGQEPFAPPSVGGWPSGEAWLSTANARHRLDFARWLTGRADLAEVSAAEVSGRVDLVARLLGVPAWSERTAAILTRAATSADRLVATALITPEYVVNA